MTRTKIAILIFAPILMILALASCASNELDLGQPTPVPMQPKVQVTVCGTAECLALIADHCKNRHVKPAGPDLADSVARMVDEVSRLQGALPKVSGYDNMTTNYDFLCDEP